MHGRAGRGILEVVHGARGSVIRRMYAASPLRLLAPLNHGAAAWVYTGSYGGGLVGGDTLHLTVRVGRHASAFLSTQASTKVYRSTSEARIDVEAEIAEEGQLVVWPDPVVCFAGSGYRQRQDFALEAGASLVLVDWMTSGRRACGERWRFDRYSSRLTVRYDGRLVLLDSLSLAAEDGDLTTRMGRFDVLCSAVVVGSRLHRDADRILERVCQLPWQPGADRLVAAAPLRAGVAAGTRPGQGGAQAGCILRVAGRSVEAVGSVLREYLSLVPRVLGDDPWARKW